MAIAPITARPLPNIGESGGGAVPALQVRLITTAPATAIKTAIRMRRVQRSFRNTGTASTTQSGLVETSTTLLVTDVYSSEVIQLAKCTPRSTPDSTSNPIAVRSSWANCVRYLAITMGVNISVASPTRQAEITSEGAPSACPKRIRIPEETTPPTPIPTTTYRPHDNY